MFFFVCEPYHNLLSAQLAVGLVRTGGALRSLSNGFYYEKVQGRHCSEILLPYEIKNSTFKLLVKSQERTVSVPYRLENLSPRSI
jgi:hypothetical protein